MDLYQCPTDTKEILLELIKRKTVSELCLEDKMFIHYLCTQKFDTDYLSKHVNSKKNA